MFPTLPESQGDGGWGGDDGSGGDGGVVGVMVGVMMGGGARDGKEGCVSGHMG